MRARIKARCPPRAARPPGGNAVLWSRNTPLDISLYPGCLGPQRPSRLSKRARPWDHTSAAPGATTSGLVVEAAGVMRAVLGAGNPGSVGFAPRLTGAPMLVVKPARPGLVPPRPGHRGSFSGHDIVASRPMTPSDLTVCSRRGGNPPRNDGRRGDTRHKHRLPGARAENLKSGPSSRRPAQPLGLIRGLSNPSTLLPPSSHN